ncbi:uncharacterized protein CPUR_05660 [Claviceps purpurea 20.1]|uniref:Uncharacterized protein n=1 Tax=Claviceps purpurea (strain 20.1) TaxID=1111077 RepID=M1W8D4_CLAP2|nr:uncharacterized protein CPUR_05660 [Claviceps purpurea 20.1]
MASSQDEFPSPEEIAPTTHHAITSELPQSIRRFDKEISSEWKRGLERFREDFQKWPLRLFIEANAGVRLCLRDLLQKKGIETKKGSGDSVPKILYEIIKFGNTNTTALSSPIRPITPAHPVNETQPIQTTQQIFQRMMQEWPNPLGLSAQSPLGKGIRPVTCDEAIFVFVVKQG